MRWVVLVATDLRRQIPAMRDSQLPVMDFLDDSEKECHWMMMSSNHPLHQHFLVVDFIDVVEQSDLYQNVLKGTLTSSSI